MFNMLGLRVPLDGIPKIPEKAGQVFLLSDICHTAIKQNVADVKSPVHFILDFESLYLILSLYFFFKNAEKITSGGLIMSLDKFGLI